jgi:hypothetical protein
MPVSRIKTIVIIILLLTNLFLLLLVIPTLTPRYQQAQQAQQQLQDLFSSYHLSLDLSVLPDSAPITALNVSYDASASLTAAKALLGETILFQEDPAMYYNDYTSSAGSFRLYRSGLCSAQLNGFSSVSDPASHASKLLKKMGLEIAGVEAHADEDNIVVVTATQSFNGIPLEPAQLTLTYTDGALTQLSGTMYLGTLSRATEQTANTCQEALVAFLGSRDTLGWVANQIIQVEQCYIHAGTAAAATTRLDPVWKITTDTGVYLVNGLTGTVDDALS